MKLLLDMNLSPTWVRFLEERGFEAALDQGALVSLDELTARVHVLPLRKG